MLTEISALLKKHGRLSLRELAGYFHMTPGAIEPMLELLIRKKQIRLVALGCSGACSGCSCASREDVLNYEPVDNTAREA